MKGMVSKEMLPIQQKCVDMAGCRLSLEGWAEGSVVKFLEVTTGQWLYRNVAVHDLAGNLEAAKGKQDPQTDTERQIELGSKGLVEQDSYLLEINLEDLENFSWGRPVSITGF